MNQLCVQIRTTLDESASHRDPHFLPRSAFFLVLSWGLVDESRSLWQSPVSSCLVIRQEINDPDCSFFFVANRKMILRCHLNRKGTFFFFRRKLTGSNANLYQMLIENCDLSRTLILQMPYWFCKNKSSDTAILTGRVYYLYLIYLVHYNAYRSIITFVINENWHYVLDIIKKDE